MHYAMVHDIKTVEREIKKKKRKNAKVNQVHYKEQDPGSLICENGTHNERLRRNLAKTGYNMQCKDSLTRD